MIKKLFGETDEKQFMYLKPRLIALGVGIVLLLIGFLLMQVGISFGEINWKFRYRNLCNCFIHIWMVQL